MRKLEGQQLKENKSKPLTFDINNLPDGLDLRIWDTSKITDMTALTTGITISEVKNALNMLGDRVSESIDGWHLPKEYESMIQTNYKNQHMESIIEFLIKNEYTEHSEDENYRSFFKEGVSSIDIANDEIVIIDDSGDWMHLPLNIYALIGCLIHHSQLSISYK